MPDGGSVFYWQCERTAYSAPLWSGSIERVRADPHTRTLTQSLMLVTIWSCLKMAIAPHKRATLTASYNDCWDNTYYCTGV